MSDTPITRGATFSANTHPTAEEFVVLDTELISGYEGAKVAERHPSGWRGYWSKAQYIADETNLGAADFTGFADEAQLAEIESSL